MKYAVRVTGLQKRFRNHPALDGLDLEIPEGSVFGLVGQNGAGKTTTFSILSGMLKPDGGEIDILGKGSFDPVRHKSDLTVLPQDSQLPGYALIDEILIYFARLQGLTPAEARSSARQVLEWVSLTDRAHSPIRTLSHGMLRRVTVAQAFLGNPSIVLLDEPTSGLDPKQVVQIRELILSKKGHQTIIVSSHILSEIEAACDYVAFIEKGKTLRQDTMISMIGKDQMITYHVDGGPVPEEAIRNALPGIRLSIAPGNGTITVLTGTNPAPPSEINRIVLNELFRSGCGIREIKLGTNLEQEYLRQI
jgi:ABC-2 type transport system ATP-binding protein